MITNHLYPISARGSLVSGLLLMYDNLPIHSKEIA